MKTQQEYWEDQIIDWENGTYGFKRNKEVPVIERFAELFRATVKNRPGILYQILQKERPAKVIEFGCGSGTYIIRWVKEGIIKSAVAVDISSQAIAYAQKTAADQGVADKITFINSSVMDFDFEKYLPADFVYGLGLTPYLTEQEMEYLFRKISKTKFFFDVHPAGVSLTNTLHIFYRYIRKHAFYRKFSEKDIHTLMQAWDIPNVVWEYRDKVHYFKKLQ